MLRASKLKRCDGKVSPTPPYQRSLNNNMHIF
nr:MAG TPA: hypothetical protein [Caudoviricetes sp.]